MNISTTQYKYKLHVHLGVKCDLNMSVLSNLKASKEPARYCQLLTSVPVGGSTILHSTKTDSSF